MGGELPQTISNEVAGVVDEAGKGVTDAPAASMEC